MWENALSLIRMKILVKILLILSLLLNWLWHFCGLFNICYVRRMLSEKFANDTKLGGVPDTQDIHAAI